MNVYYLTNCTSFLINLKESLVKCQFTFLFSNIIIYLDNKEWNLTFEYILPYAHETAAKF